MGSFEDKIPHTGQSGHGAVLPVNMLEGLFTIVAVDNIDKNARSTISTIIINTHATAMALVQYRDGQNQSREKQLKPLYISYV